MTRRAHEWPGTYRGDVAGTPATLQLTETAGALHGIIDAGGYRYRLRVQVAGTTARGTLQDPQTGGTGEASLALSGGDVLEVILAFPTAMSAREIRLSFTRNEAAAATAPAAGDAERDPRLAGTWTRNDSLASGDASLVTQLVVVMSPEGTFESATGETVGGGAGWSVSGGPSEGATGYWKTVGNILHVGNGQAWQPYARYYIEGGTLMLTFADDSRELWRRR